MCVILQYIYIYIYGLRSAISECDIKHGLYEAKIDKPCNQIFITCLSPPFQIAAFFLAYSLFFMGFFSHYRWKRIYFLLENRWNITYF